MIGAVNGDILEYVDGGALRYDKVKCSGQMLAKHWDQTIVMHWKMLMDWE